MDQNKLDLESISMLVPKAKAGDQHAQNQILEQVQDILSNLARQHFRSDLRQRQNPSDVVQQTMARMINGFEDFRGTSKNEFYAWLKTILKNEIHVMRRHQQQAKRDARRDRVPSQENPSRVFGGADPNLTPSSEAIKSEKIELLRTAMANLPPDFAQVIELRNLEEMPFQEIADNMNRSYEAVAKLWQRAVMQLEKELKKMQVE